MYSSLFWNHVTNDKCIPYAFQKSIYILKAYQDFMRYEGVPQLLHWDLAPEQKTDEILDLNRKMIVKDTWSEAGIPEQNPVEQGGVRILKNAAEVVIQRT